MKITKCFVLFIVLTTFWVPVTLEAFYLSGFEVETKVSAFVPSSKKVRNTFSDVMPYYEFEISKSIFKDWQAWLGVGYLSKGGNVACCNNKTDFHLIPVTLGVKYFYAASPYMDLYSGVGISWSFFNNKDSSPFVHQPISKEAVGGVIKLGVINRLNSDIFVDVFTEYLIQNLSFRHHYANHYTVRHSLNLSGFKLGGGLGFNF